VTNGTLWVDSDGNGTVNGAESALLASGTFTQADIDSGYLKYAHNGSETTTDSFTFNLQDGGENGSVPVTGQTFSITIAAQNDSPSLATNTGLSLNEGATGTIANDKLNEGDPDDSGAGLTYTVTATVANGTLWVDTDTSGTVNGAESPLSDSDTFSQADIDNGYLKFAHDGSETTTDSFIFDLQDGGEDGATSVTNQTFSITITAANDAPVITGQQDLYTYGTNPITISLDDLTVTDPDSTYPDDFSLAVQDGSDYGRTGATITPDDGFTGNLTVAVSVNDGSDDSNTYNLTIYVATQISVTNTNDSGAGSLRQAIADASSGDVIDLSQVSGTITLTSGTLVLDKDLTINGPAEDPLTISGDHSDRVFSVDGATVAIANLTISDGQINDHGAGIHNTGDLTLTRVTISSNVTTGAGNGAGIYNTGTLAVYNSTFSNNDAAADGGAIYNSGTMTANNCTMAENTAGGSAGGITNSGTLNISNTLLAANTPADCDNSATIETNSHNLIEDNTCSPALSGDPNLGPLQDNGGNTDTHALLYGSIAIDAADPATAESVDQRNVARPVDGDGDDTDVADIGAYEYRLGTVEFNSATFTVSEGATTATISVRRSDSCDGPSSVDYATSNGSAMSGSDYSATSGALSWNQGDAATKSFTVAISDDAIDESNETVTLSLSNLTGSMAGSQTTAVLTINDNDHTLSLAKAGDGSGTVTSSPGGIQCGNTCSAVFTNATTVTLSAAAGSNSSFTGWSGGGCSGAGDCTVTLTAAKSVTATFTAVATDPDGDDDGMPTEWEVLHGLDPAVDDADEDPDDDGLSNYQEYVKGSDPQVKTTGPGIAILILPENQQTEVSVLPTFESGYATSALSEDHSATFWQIATDEAFTDKILQITSSRFKTRLPVPNGTLDENSVYYWRVCYIDDDDALWAWSEIRSFTTADKAFVDDDNDGVPDDEEVSDTFIDLDEDGNDDNSQLDMKVIRVPNNAGEMGIKAGTNAAHVEFLSTVDVEEIEETENRPASLPRGFYNFRLILDEVGATATATVYFSTPLPSQVGWSKYDRINGWSDYSDHAQVSANRRSVTLEFQDGGFGDADGVANGVIVDPSGPAIMSENETGLDFDWENENGCFIASLDNGLWTKIGKIFFLSIATLVLSAIFCQRRN
jgi:hypothetical protein